MTGDPATGKSGTLKINSVAVVQIKNWKITKTATTSRFATNASGGWKRTVSGSKDWTATVDLVLSVGSPIPVTVGGSYPITFHIDDTDTDYYIGTGVVANDDLECNVDEGTEIMVPVSVEGDGELKRVGTLLADVAVYS